MLTRGKLRRPAGFVLFTLLSTIAIVLLSSSERPVRASQAGLKTIATSNTGNQEQSKAKCAAWRRHLDSVGKAKASTTAGAPPRSPASFLGSLTTIVAPAAAGVFLARQSDCSLTLSAFNYALATDWTYTLTAVTSHYEQTLSNEASLKAQPDTRTHFS